MTAASHSSPPPEAHQHGTLFLLDGNNIAYRAFYALPAEIATSTGFPTNALYGFCSMIIKILSEYEPEAVIVAWDAKGKTFRHEEFAEYKAQRKPMPELLEEQWQYFEELSEAFGFVNLKVQGWEADDILATLARQADAEGRRTYLVTGDRDALQLVSENVRIMANSRGVTDVKIYDPAAVEERYGIPPKLIPDFIGLKGDSSDNIPGIPGIGEKTAAQLLQEYGSLEEVLAHRNEIRGEKRRRLLEEYEETARLSKKLADLERDAPIDVHAAEVRASEPDAEKLRELFLRFEFNTLLDRLPSVLPQKDRTTPAAGRAPVAVQIGGADLERKVDWARPVGLAAGQREGRDVVWLAQGADSSGSSSIMELAEPERFAGPLRTLMARGKPVVHGLKAQPALHEFLRRAHHDTYLAAYLLAPGRRSYELSELLEEQGIAAYEKAEGGRPEGASGPATGEASGGRSPQEALNVLRLAERQGELLRNQGMWRLFQEIELPLTGVLLDMEEAGVYVDCGLLGEITHKLEDRIAELEEQIFELAGETFNLGSTQQLARILFETLGLPPQHKTKTGYSTDAKALEALRDQHPIIELILNHRELSKLLSTYLLALPELVDEQQRIHTTFHQTVTATGRLSSSDPNLQNIPVRTEIGAQIRECFSAPEGFKLVVSDYSQIELRIMAYLSGEPALLEAFREGDDIHRRTAAEVFDLPEEEVDSRIRGYAKAVNFGIMYGISPFGLAQQLAIPREEAAAYIERYFARLPRVREFIDQTIEDAKAKGFVATIFGRRRPLPEIHSRNFQTRSLGERLAVNSVIQGSAADIIKVAMLRVHERLGREHSHARLVLQVHDELITEAPEEEAERVASLMRTEMEDAFVMDPPLVADVGIGRDWLSAK
ncbi:MAG: DNA polymerase I [Thermoleophilia bacterium]